MAQNIEIALIAEIIITTFKQKRDLVRLNVTESPQVYSWSNKGKNYLNEFIKLDCQSKDCLVQVILREKLHAFSYLSLG